MYRKLLNVSLLVIFIMFASPVIGYAWDEAVLIVGTIKVRSTKANGKAWDIAGGAPDLQVIVERTSKPKGEQHTTAVKQNVFEAAFNRKTMGVHEGDTIKIRVIDEDVGIDDEVGEVSRKISADDIKSKEVKIAFDQVDELILKFE